MKFVKLFSIDGSHAQEYLEILDNQGYDALIQYLYDTNAIAEDPIECDDPDYKNEYYMIYDDTFLCVNRNIPSIQLINKK